MNKARIIPSAAYFTLVTTDRGTYGYITLATSQREKCVLCQQHAYHQVDQLLASQKIDEHEAMYIRTQVAGCCLPTALSVEHERIVQELINDGKAAVQTHFDPNYFHQEIERFLATATAPHSAVEQLIPKSFH